MKHILLTFIRTIVTNISKFGSGDAPARIQTLSLVLGESCLLLIPRKFKIILTIT